MVLLCVNVIGPRFTIALGGNSAQQRCADSGLEVVVGRRLQFMLSNQLGHPWNDRRQSQTHRITPINSTHHQSCKSADYIYLESSTFYLDSAHHHPPTIPHYTRFQRTQFQVSSTSPIHQLEVKQHYSTPIFRGHTLQSSRITSAPYPIRDLSSKMPYRPMSHEWIRQNRNKVLPAGTRRQIETGLMNPDYKKLTKDEKKKRDEERLRNEEKQRVAAEKNKMEKATGKSAHLQHGHTTKK